MSAQSRLVRRPATREEAMANFQQHRNAFIRRRIDSSNWGGRGHVHFGHSYSYAASYVCILMAALAGICLAQLSHIQRTGSAIVAQRANLRSRRHLDNLHPIEREQSAGRCGSRGFADYVPDTAIS
jgi:hypothetical protein